MSESLLERNLKSLSKNHPDFAARIRRAEDDPRIVLTQSPLGDWSASLKQGVDVQDRIHSQFDPKKEAAQLIDHAKVDNTSNVLFLGFGLGYPVLELLSRPGDRDFILIAEANLALIKAAFTVMDLAVVLEAPGVIWITENPLQQVADLLRAHSFSLLANGLSCVRLDASAKLAPRFYEEVQSAISDFFTYVKVNINTQIEKSPKFMGNALQNLEEFIRASPVRDLYGKAAGRPVFVISAGPSLDKTVTSLREIGEAGVLIVVDSALKTVLAAGVIPDFVMSIDFTPHALKYFIGVDTRGLRLVFDMEIYPEILALFAGEKFGIQLPQKSVSDFTQKVLGDKGSIEKGLSVSHAAVLLAEKMEAREIVLVGQDLAYPKSQWHTKGSTFFQPLGITDEAGLHLCETNDIFGGKVKSSVALMVFKTHFEALFRECGVPCFDATEGGAYIDGTVVISVREAVLRFCVDRASGLRAKSLSALPDEEKIAQDMDVMLAALENMRCQLEAFNHEAAGAYVTLQEAEVAFRSGKDRKKLLEVFEAIQKIAAGLDEKREILNFLKDAATEALILRAKKIWSGQGANRQLSDEEILKKIKKECMFFAVLVRASNFAAQEVTKTLNRMRAKYGQFVCGAV